MGAKKYSTSEKAAILMLGLGESLAAEIFKHLSDVEAHRLAGALARLGPVDKAVVSDVMTEFRSLLESPRRAMTGDRELVRRILARAYPGDRSTALSDLVESGLETRLPTAELLDAETLARLIQAEQPQTIALILAHSPPAKAADTLRRLPATGHVDIVLRLAKLTATSPEVVAEIDDFLQSELARLGSVRGRKIGGIEKAAAILNSLGGDDDGKVLGALGERDHELSEKIRDAMFVFDDLVRLDTRSMQAVVRAVPQKTWAVALRGAAEKVSAHVYANMSSRMAAMLRDEIALSKPLPVADVRAARASILDTVRALINDGTVALPDKATVYV